MSSHSLKIFDNEIKNVGMKTDEFGNICMLISGNRKEHESGKAVTIEAGEEEDGRKATDGLHDFPRCLSKRRWLPWTRRRQPTRGSQE